MKFENALKNSGRKKTAALGASEQAKTTTQTATPRPMPAQSPGNGHKTVTIEARIDVGFGNKLYVRGEGQGLSWNQGIPLACVGSSTWKWSGPAAEKLKFKLLLNDSIWSKGEDLVVGPGEKLEVAPAF